MARKVKAKEIVELIEQQINQMKNRIKILERSKELIIAIEEETCKKDTH